MRSTFGQHPLARAALHAAPPISGCRADVIIGAAEFEFECAHQTVDKDRAMAGSLSLLLVLFAVSVL